MYNSWNDLIYCSSTGIDKQFICFESGIVQFEDSENWREIENGLSDNKKFAFGLQENKVSCWKLCSLHIWYFNK